MNGHLTILSASAASDGAYIAVGDISSVLRVHRYRLIGGVAVMLHQQRLALTNLPIRATADADFGVPPFVLKQPSVIEQIERLGYIKTAGNRWTRRIDESLTATCDLLVPSYASRSRSAVRVGTLNTTEVPGLAVAFRREPTKVTANVRLTNGASIKIDVDIPDIPATLGLKLNSRRVRSEERDALDLYTCMEAVVADGTQSLFGGEDFVAERSILRSEFASGSHTTDIILRGFAPTEHDRIKTRIRGLVQALAPDNT